MHHSSTVQQDVEIHEPVEACAAAPCAPAPLPLQARVRGLVRRFMEDECCSNARIATKLGLHPRTLHRRLKAEGTSFQAIKDSVRREAALYYLQQTDLDLTRIAGKLGYAEHSVFSRSCVRWFSTSPSRLRLQSAALDPGA